jgi:hypothetical protein
MALLSRVRDDVEAVGSGERHFDGRLERPFHVAHAVARVEERLSRSCC